MNLICPSVRAAANMEKPVYMMLSVSLPTRANQFDFKKKISLRTFQRSQKCQPALKEVNQQCKYEALYTSNVQ